eukprot:863779-Prymnesium_polylepis.1
MPRPKASVKASRNQDRTERRQGLQRQGNKGVAKSKVKVDALRAQRERGADKMPQTKAKNGLLPLPLHASVLRTRRALRTPC